MDSIGAGHVPVVFGDVSHWLTRHAGSSDYVKNYRELPGVLEKGLTAWSCFSRWGGQLLLSNGPLLMCNQNKKLKLAGHTPSLVVCPAFSVCGRDRVGLDWTADRSFPSASGTAAGEMWSPTFRGPILNWISCPSRENAKSLDHLLEGAAPPMSFREVQMCCQSCLVNSGRIEPA